MPPKRKKLARMLYLKNAKVYILSRSAEKTDQAIIDIKKAVPSSTGTLTFLHLGLADLSSIKVTVDRFFARERSLHVHFNNAGVLSSEKKLTTTPQGYKQHVGINVLGGFLLTQLLTPLLVATAKTERPNTVRVIWTGSSASEMFAQKNIGATADMMQKEALVKKSGNERYWASKVGNWSHGVEYALRP
ncbi:putative Short-chain dehydrogenase [Seiridium cardinale]|uniref:Short-chain dehydrogenase n=1 Tax=Seiridium cardinale TaxID=138064 RepID=A0ABR2Y4A7_9PEZI